MGDSLSYLDNLLLVYNKLRSVVFTCLEPRPGPGRPQHHHPHPVSKGRWKELIPVSVA